ncbi:MAG: chemotaxis protein CheX [Wolinella sp.]
MGNHTNFNDKPKIGQQNRAKRYREMKPTITQDVAVYYSEPLLDIREAKNICETLIANTATFKSIKIQAIFFSLEKTKEMDEQAILVVAKTLLALKKRLEVLIAFCGYNDAQFTELKTILPDKSVPLFKHVEMAMLFWGIKIPRTTQPIVLFDRDDMVQAFVSQELSSKGFVVHAALNEQDFQSKRSELGDNAIYIYDIYFDVVGSFIPTTVTKGIVIYKLYDTLDEKVSTHFNSTSHAQRINEGYKVFAFDASEVRNMNIKAIDFFVSIALNGMKHEVFIAIFGMHKDLIALDISQKMSRSGIKFFDSEEALIYDSYVAWLVRTTESKRQIGLTKKLISKLPIFIDASLETLTSLTGGEAQKQSHKITQATIKESRDLLGAVITFEGDISGTLALAFHRSIAQEAGEMMLGEHNLSTKELLDVISEFANIIAGRSKALLSEDGTTISISLPRTCGNFGELMEILGNRQGVQIDLLLNGKSLYLFLTH